MRPARLFPALLALSCAWPASAQDSPAPPVAAAAAAEQVAFFESKIRPALVKHCYECHSSSAASIKGGLKLDTREATLRGGHSGPALEPGSPEDSLLYLALTWDDPDTAMPPKTQLPPGVIADFERWIRQGAADPREEQSDLAGRTLESYASTIDVEAGRDFWAYQKPAPSPLPVTSDPGWARSELDHFLLAALDAAGLAPSPDAEPEILARRLHFDLTGLPPRSDDLASFIDAWQLDPEQALAELVDSLIDSPAFGERFGRHWLDVARYAESSGKDFNTLYPHAWRYRDYVIDAFNAGMPYDQFIAEQVAGDLLPADSAEEKARQIIATGFLALGTKSLNEQSVRQFRFDLVDEQIDTVTRAVLGTSAACARCHDHKSDPIPMWDYYALAGIFLSSETLYGTARGAQGRHAAELAVLPLTDEDPALPRLSPGQGIDLQFQIERLRDQIRDTLADAAAARRSGNADSAQRLRQSLQRVRTELGLLEARRDSHDLDGNPLPLAMGMRDAAEPFDAQLLFRGEEDLPSPHRPPRGFLQVIQTGDEEPLPDYQSGRLQLARWLVSAENPLAARVMVNRAWHWIFGAGLVATVDDFGASGQPPSHPELLDHLAARFVESGWSIKNLAREIALSRAYRQSSAWDEEKFLADPENRLLWRYPPRRLDAESLRDAMLAVSGRLDLDRPPASSVARFGDGIVGRTVRDQASLTAEHLHRSVYLPVVRDLVPESLSLFDFADPSLLTGERDVTTVPSQALYLMNSGLVLASAEAMASRVAAEPGGRPGLAAFRLAYGRSPSSQEMEKTKVFFERFVAAAKAEGQADDAARRLALAAFCQSLLSSAEFRYLN